MYWNDYFNAPDFDWAMTKQSEKKCTLLFPDRHLYCLCPLFTLEVFMLFGGLHRDLEKTKGAVVKYVFPLLHGQRKDGVADSLSTVIKKQVQKEWGQEFKGMYSSRSTCKGGMTEMRTDRSLSTQEEYAQSGHTAPGSNPNAEGYIESTHALSAPGGISLAGHSDPHSIVYPI
eukprot:scaffold159419_cov62-Cyclotella_meneghiniana.AAC.1